MSRKTINTAANVAKAFKRVLKTEAFNEGGFSRSALGHEVAAINAALVSAGEPERLSDAVSVEIVTRDSGRQDPEDCPHIRISLGDSLAAGYEPWAVGDTGEATYSMSLIVYLTQEDVVGDDTNVEESLALQAAHMVDAVRNAVRRPDGTGLWGRAGSTVYNLDLADVQVRNYATRDELRETLGYAAVVTMTWEIKQDVYY